MRKLFNRLWSTLIEEVFTNWRLVLLGLTGLALSLASGWTTWDGMTNFTGNPVLSGLITFGIQGVMQPGRGAVRASQPCLKPANRLLTACQQAVSGTKNARFR